MSDEAEQLIITILPQIEDLLYPLKPEELAHLESSIRQHGVREPLCLWDRDGELILFTAWHYTTRGSACRRRDNGHRKAQGTKTPGGRTDPGKEARPWTA